MWGLYVDPKVKTDTTMLIADLVGACVAFMKSIGCHKILTLCSSTKMCKLLTSACSFHSSNTLVLDMLQPTRNVTDQAQSNHHIHGVTQEMVDNLRQSHESLNSLPDLELSWLLIANHNQLEALGRTNDVKSCVERIQRDFYLYQDPADNWFTRNVTKLGKGFDLEKLSKNPQASAAKFDKLAPNYDAWTLGNQSKIESWIVKMARQHNLLKDLHVLDLCCGTGLQGLTLRLCGFKGILTGIDVSSKMIEAAQHRCCYDHLLVANVNQGIQQPRMMADLILCTGAMELLDIGDALATFSRLLKHGGMLWVTFQTRQENLMSTAHQNAQGLEIETMKRELALYGFEIESIDFHPNAFYTPSPDLDGALLPVPYFFVCGRKKDTVS
jgi:ubiquinone/menaquinone biosynthesis C-methylase UbiE